MPYRKVQMMRFENPRLNRGVRDTCRAVHVKHAGSIQTAESNEDGTFRTVYVVTSDRKRMIRVTHHVEKNTWEVEAPGVSVSAMSDGKALEHRLDLEALVNGLTGEMREGQLWKGAPRMNI